MGLSHYQKYGDAANPYARMELCFLKHGQLLVRQSVTSELKLKPGAKKTIRQPLPPGASRCQVVSLRPDKTAKDQLHPVEFICGRGVADPMRLLEKQEPVAIQRLTYANGTNWTP